MAPLKAAVFPLVQQPEMNSTARSISAALTRAGLANTVDTTGAFPESTNLKTQKSPVHELICRYHSTRHNKDRQLEPVSLVEKTEVNHVKGMNVLATFNLQGMSNSTAPGLFRSLDVCAKVEVVRLA